MNGVMPLTTTATQIQRNYKKVINMVKRAKEPVTVLSNNKPEVVIMDYRAFAGLSKGLPKKKAGRRKSLGELFGSWSKEEGDKFDRVIEGMFEQVDPESWK